MQAIDHFLDQAIKTDDEKACENNQKIFLAIKMLLMFEHDVIKFTRSELFKGWTHL